MDFHSPEDYTAYHTRRQKEEIRKNLKKKIDTYNKKLKKKTSKTLADSLPISKPSEDLVYKGVIKVVHDSGFALQSKAVLVESTTTVAEVVQQATEAFNLVGGADDYALEERDILAGTSQLLVLTEIPLQRRLGYGSQESYYEFRLVELQPGMAGPVRRLHPLSVPMQRRSRSGSNDSLEDSTSIAPKEEVIDHGVSNIEITLEEGLQDIPPLVGEIQERLQTMVSTVTIDGVPKSNLPPRRMLWDILKPQAAQLVKEIRRCVDSCEFLANRYCSSSVCKLIVSLLLELITDHSKELVSVTKELCALRGAPQTEFDTSVDNFVQQTEYISKLIGLCNDCLRAVALTGHLLEVTTPNKFITIGTIQPESHFTGSKSVSGVLIFSVVAAYLGLVRAGYEEKADYYASLAANVLKSAHKALETVQKTEEYKLLHLHPLNSRVKDMEHKQKKTMDGLISSVRQATSSKATPDTIPAMLLKGHSVLMATLDYLMVAQCASLLHKVVVGGWQLLQLPWVRGVLLSKRSGGSSDNSSDAPKTPSLAPSLSSVGTGSDNAEDDAVSVPSQRAGKPARRQRKLPVLTKREQGDGAYDDEATEASSQVPSVSFAQLGIRASRLQLTGDIGLPIPNVVVNGSGSVASDGVNLTDEDTDSNDEGDDENEEHPAGKYNDQKRYSVAGASVADSVQAGAAEKKEPKKQSQFSVLDALEKLRHNYSINKEIAKVSESLLMTLTQKNNLLTMAVKDGASESYTEITLLIIGIAKQIREEVSVMESDLLVGQSMAEALNKSKQQFNMIVRNVHTMSIMASVSSHAHDGSSAKLLNNVAELQTISSGTVGDALKALSEHKVALDQAEKIEQEFVSLMTGHQKYEEKLFKKTRQASIRKTSAPAKFMTLSDSEVEKVITEQRNPNFKMSMQQWTAKGSAKVTGGTVRQLMDKLVYHRTIDAEFVNVFLLTFHSFMTPMQLMKGLIDRYSITMPEDLSEEEREAFKSGVLIPIRLRIVHAMKSWLNKSYNDFKNEQLKGKLKAFINLIEKFMPSSAKELHHLLSESQANGPEHLREKPKAKPPPSIVPEFLTNGEKFDILDVNTLELARQMAITYSTLFRRLSAEELMIGSSDNCDSETRDSKACVTELSSLSKTITFWVSKEIVSEGNLEDRASVISYFIQAANSCFELKNFEVLFAVMAGLQSTPVDRLAATWKRVSSQLIGTFKILCRVVSPDSDYRKYHREISAVGDGPCVPYIALITEEASKIMTDHSDFLPEKNEVINFEKRRLLAQLITLVQCYQSVPYSFTPVHSLQDKLLTMEVHTTEKELLQLSWQSEMT